MNPTAHYELAVQMVRLDARRESQPVAICHLNLLKSMKKNMTVERNVPSDALYKAWHMGPRISNDYPTLDLLTDLLGRR